MKKAIIILLAALCICAMLAGCASPTEADTAPQTETPASTAQTTETPKTDGEPAAETPAEEAPAEEAPTEEAPAETYTFIDGRGIEVTAPKNPQRVICTYGSYCPLWYECGGTLVYRKDIYSSYTLSPELEAVPVLADGGDISAEIVLEAEPDLVIMNTSSSDLEMAELLEAAGVPCLLYNYSTFEEYLDLVKIFTELTERPDLYEEYATNIKARVDAVRETIGDHSVEAVLIMPSASSPSFTSATSMCGSMLRDLNVVLLSYPDGDYTQDKYEFSMEKLLELDPQYILTAGGGEDQEAAAQRVLDWPGFTELTAYKEGRYRHLDVSMYMYKPNGRYAEAYEQLAAFLYPDLFD